MSVALELLSSDHQLRLDGRKSDELRRLECRMGGFGQADGSAYLELGNTRVLAAVYGPHSIRGGSGGKSTVLDNAVINCQYSMAVFSTGERKNRPRGDRKSQEMTMHLRQIFEAAIRIELYPRSQIDIFVEVMQADGGNYCACVNVATLALIDAGIYLKDYVCACTASLVEDIPLIDLNNLEGSMGGPELTLALLPKSEEIVLMEMSQRFHIDNLNKVMEAAIRGCREIHKILEQVVRRYVCHGGASLGWDNLK